jgi:hypothetical protein
MTKEEALELLNTILPDHKPGESRLWDAIGMAAEALKAWEPEAECEACKVNYEDDLK